MKSKAVEILEGIKAFLKMDSSMPAPAPSDTATSCTMADGTVVMVDTLAVGGHATINGVPAPANTYQFVDGSSIVVDATGTITAYNPAPDSGVVATDAVNDGSQKPSITTTPATPTASATPATPAAPQKMSAFKFSEIKTDEELTKLFASFATGTPEDRITNLETMVRALMESEFGWQIRQVKEKAATDAAIATYTNDLQSVNATMSAQSKKIEKCEGALAQMITLFEEFAAHPLQDPPTGIVKKEFSLTEQIGKTRKGISKYTAALEKISKENKQAAEK